MRHDDLVAQSRKPPRAAIAIPFGLERLRQLSEQSADRLSDLQARAIETVIFFMRATDRLNDESRLLTEKIELMGIDIQRGDASARLQVPGLWTIVRERYGEERQLLSRILTIIDDYLSDALSENRNATAGSPSLAP